MLSMTKKTGYGLIALSHLAKMDGEELASAREISDRYEIPLSLLMNVLKELSSAGFVESVRGAHGGYRLAVEPEEISLADLITTVEGPIRLAECIADHDRPDDRETCPLLSNCPIADPVHRVHRRLADFLKTVTLAEIIAPAAITADEP